MSFIYEIEVQLDMLYSIISSLGSQHGVVINNEDVGNTLQMDIRSPDVPYLTASE